MYLNKEKLIREIIQIELLYQTKKQLKLLKENTDNPDPTPESTPDDTTIQSKEKKEKKYSFNSSFPNDFIKKHFQDITLTGTYQTTDLNKIEIKDLTPADLNVLKNKLKDIFEKELNIDSSVTQNLVNIFISADLEKSETVFKIFENDFPIQSKVCNGNEGLTAFSKYLNEHKTKEYFKNIFNTAKGEGNDSYGAGRGEFLSVLLLKDAVSGGGKKIDVIKPGKNCEIKQAESSTKTMRFSLSVKSGLLTYKEKATASYTNLVNKAFELKEEFEKLNVDSKLLKKLNNNAATGYLSANIDLKQKESDSEDNGIKLNELHEIFRQAFKALKSKTYNNVINFEQNTDNMLKEENDISKILPDVKQALYIAGSDGQTGVLMKGYTQNVGFPQVEKASNVSDNVKKFFDMYSLKLLPYNLILSKNNLMQSKEYEEYEEYEESNSLNDAKDIDNLQWINHNIQLVNNISCSFKTLNIEDYNNKLKENIKKSDNINSNLNIYDNVIKYFSLKNDAPIIKDISVNLNDSQMQEQIEQFAPDFFGKLKKFFVNTDYYDQIYYNMIDVQVKKKFREELTKLRKPKYQSSIDKQVNTAQKYIANWSQIINYIYNVCNSRVILTFNQMKKINDIITLNISAVSELKNKNINKTTMFDNKDYVIVEPLNIENIGEYIVDISYFKNNKIRHIDTLHSKDLSSKNLSNETSNTGYYKEKGKDTRIAAAAGHETTETEEIGINLYDVISDKNLINNKIKSFNFFNSIQPSVLEKLFTNQENNNNFQLKKISDVSNIELNDNVFNLDNQNSEFVKLLQSKESNLNSFLSDYYSLYTDIIKLEEAVKKYYIEDNNTLIFYSQKGQEKEFLKTFNYIDIIQKTGNDGFILNFNPKEITCIVDPDYSETAPTIAVESQLNEIKKSSSNSKLDDQEEDQKKKLKVKKEKLNESKSSRKTTMRKGIKELFSELLKLMLEIQQEIRQ